MTLIHELYEEILQMPVIDTHEHLPRMDNTDPEQDILEDYLSHYFSCDLRSAGLSAKDLIRARDKTIPLLERWKILEPYWEICRYTGYGRALDIAVRGIYDFEQINGDTIEPLSEQYRKRKSPGHFYYVLKELCNIELSILDSWASKSSYDKTLFRQVWHPAPLISPNPDQDIIASMEKDFGLTIRSLEDWLHAIELELEDNLNHGVVALKNAMAYHRSLRYNKVSLSVAKEAFTDALNRRTQGLWFSLELQDYLMHYCLQLANQRGLVMQVHTGLQEGNGNILSNSDPSLLNNLFLDYPDVTFDLFHISYPYQGIACALAKNFPNVYVDMCWAHIISPAASMSALDDFLDAIPYNKILGFGGDYLFVDGVYGHLHLARENISRVLSEKVQHGVFSIDQAITIAQHLLYKNPKKLFLRT